MIEAPSLLHFPEAPGGGFSVKVTPLTHCFVAVGTGYGMDSDWRHGMYQGKGLSTCYGHQSAILVHVGQRVRRGDLIGRVGTTGASTGDHLHFEVRVDGSPVQPLDYLDPCLC